MLARFIYSMNWFSTAKYQIFRGKYLVPPAPKRSLSNFILFSNDVRQSLTVKTPDGKISVAETAKKIGQKWKTLTPEEKKKYDDKAKQLKEKYEHEINKYNQLYVNPFKKTNYNTLMMREFYSKNKVNSLAEGAEQLKKMHEGLTEQDKAKYQKLAEEQNKSNEKIAKQYQIPVNPYKTFAAYLRHLHKEKNLPKKSQLDDNQLEKLKKQYEQVQQGHKQQLAAFARSFHITMPDLIKLINKQKDSSEKLDQYGNELKQVAAKEKSKAIQEYKESKEKLAAQKKKILDKKKKESQRQIKKLQTQVQKKKKAAIRVNTKFSGKLGQYKRKKTELELSEKAQKKLQKTKQSQNTTTPTDGTADSKTQPSSKTPKKAGRPKKTKTEASSTSASTSTQTQQKSQNQKPKTTATETTQTKAAQTQTQASK